MTDLERPLIWIIVSDDIVTGAEALIRCLTERFLLWTRSFFVGQIAGRAEARQLPSGLGADPPENVLAEEVLIQLCVLVAPSNRTCVGSNHPELPNVRAELDVGSP